MLGYLIKNITKTIKNIEKSKKTLIDNFELKKWNWYDEDWFEEQTSKLGFQYKKEVSFDQTKFPLKGFFDFTLKRKR